MTDRIGAVHWRDTFSVWPVVRVELMPWNWHLRWYHEPHTGWGTGYFQVQVGPLEASGNWPPFPLERIAAPSAPVVAAVPDVVEVGD
jgi:hypothetical protein